MKQQKSTTFKNTVLAAALSVAGVAGLSNLPANSDNKGPKIYPGPYYADVVKITDSDTIKLQVHMWPDQVVNVGLRVSGIDTPEKFRPKCDAEKFKAIDATRFVETLLPLGSRVSVTDVKPGKYARRAIGVITYKTAAGNADTLANALIRRRHAVPYYGGTKTKDWCAE